MQAVQHLKGRTGIDVNAKNANGYSALDILELTPTDLRDANYLQIKNCLEPINRQKQKSKWLKHESIMVVAILIATIAFHAGTTPPGGVWQGNATDNSPQAGTIPPGGVRQGNATDNSPKAGTTPPGGVWKGNATDNSPQAGTTPSGGVLKGNATDNSPQAGESVLAYIHPKAYSLFIIANNIAFLSSISMILFLIIGLPFPSRLFECCLMVIMWISVTSIAVVYGVSIRVITPKKDTKTLVLASDIWIIVWYSGMVIPNAVYRLLQKRGITMWRPRRFFDSVFDRI